jgi:hypothetical protein
MELVYAPPLLQGGSAYAQYITSAGTSHPYIHMLQQVIKLAATRLPHEFSDVLKAVCNIQVFIGKLKLEEIAFLTIWV